MSKLKKLNLIKSKKGFTLIELLCAMLIIVVVVASTVTALAVSYKSVTLGAEKDKGTSLCQEYCDIISTYIKNNSSPVKDTECNLTDDIYGNLKTSFGVSDDFLQQIKKADISTAEKKYKKIYFAISKSGTFTGKDSKTYSTYELTTYYFYTSEYYANYTANVTIQHP